MILAILAVALYLTYRSGRAYQARIKARPVSPPPPEDSSTAIPQAFEKDWKS